MTAKEQQLEGEFRYVNSRIITNSEEIAFYQGDSREKSTVYLYFNRLITHLRDLTRFQLVMGFIDHIVAKYLATTIGYLSVSIPFMDLSTAKFLNASPERLREDYYKLVVSYYNYNRVIIITLPRGGGKQSVTAPSLFQSFRILCYVTFELPQVALFNLLLEELN